MYDEEPMLATKATPPVSQMVETLERTTEKAAKMAAELDSRLEPVLSRREDVTSEAKLASIQPGSSGLVAALAETSQRIDGLCDRLARILARLEI